MYVCMYTSIHPPIYPTMHLPDITTVKRGLAFRKTTSTLTQKDCRGILCMYVCMYTSIHPPIYPTMHLPVLFSILSLNKASNDLPIHFILFFIYMK